MPNSGKQSLTFEQLWLKEFTKLLKFSVAKLISQSVLKSSYLTSRGPVTGGVIDPI